MPRNKAVLPSYTLHKATGQARVRIDGKDFYLGPYDSAESREKYGSLIARFVAGRGPEPQNAESLHVSVSELILAFWRHAETHYRHGDGTPTTELKNLRLALRPLNDLFGHSLAHQFGPLALKAVRQKMIDLGHCRTRINRDIGRIKMLLKWAVENELVYPSVYHGLQAVRGLQRGRTTAKESDPVKPVPEPFVKAVLPYLRPQIRAMVELQLITGMRSGEVTSIRGCDLETTGRLWEYRPARHKTEHHGHEKLVYLGPQAQTILQPWLRTELTAYLFQPREAEAARDEERKRNRKTPMTPSQAKRKPKRNPKRAPGDHYTVRTYHQAVQHGIESANKRIDDPAKQVPHWHPHQLRHNAATRLRKEFGLEAARVVLGHRSAAVTEIYAEIDHAKAAEIMMRVG
jgi:integrase